MRYPNAILVIACLLSTSLARAAEDDTFDKFDRALEGNFVDIDSSLERQYRDVDQAMEDAYRNLGKAVGKAWGVDEVRLPDMKTWVDYTPDLKTRRIIDFDHGEVKLERLVGADEDSHGVIADLARAADAVEHDSDQDLARKDLALNWARQELAAKGIKLGAPGTEDTKPVLGGVAPAIDRQRLVDAVSEALARGESTPEAVAPALPDRAGIVVASVAALEDGKRKVVVTVPFNAGFAQTLASRYLDVVEYNADRNRIPTSLVLAVMDTESAFNPRATSPVPAYGLMQLVPASGAMDAYQFVYGGKRLVDPEYLYNPARNVELGAAYLSVLDQRYLNGIENVKSREYCTIAAYNTGAGNVARAFTGKTDIGGAIGMINRMTPGEVYNQLTTKLPYEETRRYLVKVTEAQKKYFSYDGAKL